MYMNHPKVTMVDTRVLVLPDKAADFYDEKGTLIIPDIAKESPPQGEVISVGAKCEVVEEGQKVLYTRGAGVRTEFNKIEYLILREHEIHCIL
jgi:co-chaperonin GroES (HSP10)